MTKIKNEANKVEEIVDVNRAQIEHRATWMALIFDEMRKAGVPDAEQIVRRAIRRCGQFHGKRNFHDVMEDKSSCVDFDKVFQKGVGPATFNMDNFSSDADNMKVEFNYCALVSAWQKLGFDDETIALLCDMAMDGDRGIADANNLKLTLGGTIAEGCKTCNIHFHK